MLSAGHRMSVLIGMWVAVGLGFFAMGIYGAETGRDVGWIFVLTLLAALFTTIVLSGALPGVFFGAPGQEKTKRRQDDKLALLLELMDETSDGFKDRSKSGLAARATAELPYDAELLRRLNRSRLLPPLRCTVVVCQPHTASVISPAPDTPPPATTCSEYPQSVLSTLRVT